MADNRNRSCQITAEGIKLIEKIRMERGWNKSQLQEYLIDRTKIESIARILRIKRGEKNTIDLIATALDISPTDLVDEKEWFGLPESSETKASVVNWRSVSKGMLDNLKRLTTEALTAGDGIRFDFDDIFVPLGVVERQQKTKRKEDDGTPDRGSELYEEKVTPITHDEFFKDVLLRGNTKISNGKRIAVIGEAGAGKTTQLQKIGSWLLEKSDDIPVWISLTDLGAKSLREYLFENWVREASGEIEVAPQAWKDSLGDAIKSGKVWLLLDGVDEMTVSNPLSYLSTQLKESWLKNVRVVLTCRVNVWDGGKNALTGFDVYRNLDFDYPNDVYQFIGKWFAHTPELSGSLTQALEQSGKERIRDMVKNPLRLTLLCYSWQLKQGELPETKAGLYEWFVEAFYKWNKGKAQIELSRSREDELNRALGELAKRAIDGETSRFRLTKTFIENVFREFDIDLFDIALKLNWLNEIGVAAEDPLETVYAFYHPSFQEFFAALAINDWDFFLPRDHVNKPVKGKRYRVFESSWQEVILIWSGISKDLNKSNEIYLFTDKLLTFQDGCSISNNYRDLGYFIGLDITIESNNLKLFDIILDQIIEWAFGYYTNDDEAKYKLRCVPKEILISKISKLLPSIVSENILLDVVNFLLSINNDNSVTLAIEYLLKLAIKSSSKEKLTGTIWHIQYRREIIARDTYLIRLFVEFIYSLDLNFRYIIFGNIEEDTLSRLVYSTDSNESTYLLEKLFVDNPNKLVNIFTIFNWAEFRFASSEHRTELVQNDVNSIDLQVLRENIQKNLNQDNTSFEIEPYFLIEEHEDDTEKIIYCTAREIITDYIPCLPIHVNFSEDTKYHYSDCHSESFNIILQILKMEKIVDTHNPFAFAEIDYEGMSYEDIYKVAVENLSRRIQFWNDIDKLSDDEFDYSFCYRLLFNCAQNLSYPNFYSSWHIFPNLESQVIDCSAIQKELDRNTDHPEIRCLVIDIRQLEQENDPNIIAKKLTNKIFNSIGRRIPVVQDVSCLERELLNLKFDLGVEKLAIALYGKNANEAIDQLCQNLTDSIHICPFTGEKSTQELTNEVKAWLRRINLEYN